MHVCMYICMYPWIDGYGQNCMYVHMYVQTLSIKEYISDHRCERINMDGK